MPSPTSSPVWHQCDLEVKYVVIVCSSCPWVTGPPLDTLVVSVSSSVLTTGYSSKERVHTGKGLRQVLREGSLFLCS